MKNNTGLAPFLTAVLSALLITSCGGNSNNDNNKSNDSSNEVAEAPSFPYSYDCSVFAESSTSEYILPYEIGNSFDVYPHAPRADLRLGSPTAITQFYSIDIPMPIGTPIIAIKSGTVVRIEESYSDKDYTVGHENFVILEHDDGTLGRYFHLTKDGALVNVGDVVLQLERIGLSGDTGNSFVPHLHFDVASEFCDANADIFLDFRLCQTLPLSFRNTRTNDCGLEHAESYIALSF